jgi:hypothetical protein
MLVPAASQIAVSPAPILSCEALAALIELLPSAGLGGQIPSVSEKERSSNHSAGKRSKAKVRTNNSH